MPAIEEFVESGVQRPILDSEHYEIINGERVETPRMGVYETWIASILDHVLGPFAKANGLGRVSPETLFNLQSAGGNHRRPDLAFVSYERWPQSRRVPRMAAWDVVPDLAVEVVSQGNSAEEIQTKTQEYFRAGVRLVWIVFPKGKSVQVWDSASTCQVLNVGQALEGGDVIPGFRLSLAELFEQEIEEAEHAANGIS